MCPIIIQILGTLVASRQDVGFFLYENDIRNHQKASRYNVVDETYSLSTSTLYSKAIGAKVFDTFLKMTFGTTK